MRMWVCTKCGEELELTRENFSVDKRIKRGFKSYCKKCHNLQQAEYRKTDEYRAAHAKAKRKWNKDNPDHHRKHEIRFQTRKKYGSPPEGFEYHHEEPYHVDKWELIRIKDHYRLHQEGGG